MTLGQSVLEVGDRLPPVTRTVTIEKIGLFEAAGQAMATKDGAGKTPVNIHTDGSRARDMGLAQPIASGQMSFAYLHELLARQFGADFRQGGRLSVTFLKPVGHGDTITAHGEVAAKDQIDHRTRLSVDVWLENQRGEKTSVGKAEVIIPSPLT